MKVRWAIMRWILFVTMGAGTAHGGVIADGSQATEYGYYSGSGSPAAHQLFGPTFSTDQTYVNNGPTNPDGNVNDVDYSPSRMTFVSISSLQGPIDLVFTVTNSAISNSDDSAQRAGITQYDFTIYIRNSTGVNFEGFKLQLGSGTGSGFTSPTESGLSFDTSPATGTLFALDQTQTSPTIHTATLLAWPDITNLGGHNRGITTTSGMVPVDFSIEVPDDPASESNGYSFTLRAEYIPVPEPATAVFLSVGLIPLQSRRRASTKG